jgi:ATP-dependent Clp protease ATP-binding subunit ClpA
VWQRFSAQARKVVFYAQEETQKHGEGYVLPEHLLLGVLRESDSVAGRVIALLGVNRDDIRAAVEAELPNGDGRSTPDMTLTPRSKKAIDLAYDEARNLANDYIGSEHLLLGLIREHDGLAGRTLEKMGVELERTREVVIELQQAGHKEEVVGDGQRTRTHDVSTLIQIARANVAIPRLQLLIALSDTDGVGSKLLEAFGADVNSLRYVTEKGLISGFDKHSVISLESILALADASAKERGGALNSGDLVVAIFELKYEAVFSRFMPDVTLEQMRAKLAELCPAPE